MSQQKIPIGGFVKQVEGKVTQIFDSNGKLTYQEFIPGPEVEYFDEHMRDISSDGFRGKFNATFDMKQPAEVSVEDSSSISAKIDEARAANP